MHAHTDRHTDGTVGLDTTRYGTEVVVVSLSGELDRAGMEGARTILAEALTEPSKLVVLDLGGLEFIDSSGVEMLYGLARIRPGRESLRLLPSRDPAVNRILRLTEVGSVMNLVAA